MKNNIQEQKGCYGTIKLTIESLEDQEHDMAIHGKVELHNAGIMEKILIAKSLFKSLEMDKNEIIAAFPYLLLADDYSHEQVEFLQ